jgi:hypothetical protein
MSHTKERGDMEEPSFPYKAVHRLENAAAPDNPTQEWETVFGCHGLIIFLPVRGRSIVLAKNVLFVTKFTLRFTSRVVEEGNTGFPGALAQKNKEPFPAP